MLSIPSYLSINFIIITVITIWLFLRSSKKGTTIAFFFITGWATLQCIISLSGFYQRTETFPPRFPFLILIPIITILLLFLTKRGKAFIDQFDPKALTILHSIRIPVELVLFALFHYKAIPELMTFEGRNWDIISGLTAPIIYYWGYIKGRLNWKIILLWNIICLLLLFNIVIHAALSIPSPLQIFGFDQPNRAILQFPFVWLPSVVVPLVLLAHLICIRGYYKNRGGKTSEE